MNRIEQAQKEVTLWRIVGSTLTVAMVVFFFIGYTKQNVLLGFVSIPLLAFAGLSYQQANNKKYQLSRFIKKLSAWGNSFSTEDDASKVTQDDINATYTRMLDELFARQDDLSRSNQVYPTLYNHELHRTKEQEQEILSFIELCEELGFERPARLPNQITAA